MTLGDIFGKLSVISLKSILKVYGWISWIALSLVFIFFLVWVGLLALNILFAAVPAPLVFLTVFLLGGLITHFFVNQPEEDFPSEL